MIFTLIIRDTINTNIILQAVEELEKTKEEMAKLEDLKKQLEERNVMLDRELQELKSSSGSTEDQLSDAEERIESLMKMKFDFEEKLKVKSRTICFVLIIHGSLPYWLNTLMNIMFKSHFIDDKSDECDICLLAITTMI